jgi:adenylosuccinate synthase
MSLSIVIGSQWGDEGKGRIVDLLSSQSDFVARFSGGDNAGHTVTVGDQVFKLHTIPSGIVHKHTIAILGGGMVINPFTFLDEVQQLKEAGVDTSPNRLLISHAAHLITPAHRLLDQAQDAARGKQAIGTTGRGIGPAYVDKAARRGIRARDILDPASFPQKVSACYETINRSLVQLFGQNPINVEEMSAEFITVANKLAPHICDCGALLRGALTDGSSVLAEGAQGTLLDIDHGTYPFVTSSCTTAPGVLSGLGLGIRTVDRVIGVTKAFQTRVGSGPFPTELEGEAANHLRGSGANPWDEFGTTTGRPRRVGWLDAVLLRYAIEVNGITELCITKADVLSGLASLEIASAYDLNGEQIKSLPFGPESGDLEAAAPICEELPGWNEDISQIKTWAELPRQAQGYIETIEALSGVPVKMISVGPERSQYISR